jgi:hypothetical protein
VVIGHGNQQMIPTLERTWEKNQLGGFFYQIQESNELENESNYCHYLI